MRPLLASDVITVGESHCGGGEGSRWQAARVGDSYEIVVARHGAYARETVRGVRLAHQGVALIGRPRESYRISHPVPGGDTCSVFRVPPDGARAILSRTGAPRDGDLADALPDDVTIDGRAYLAHRLAVRAANAAPHDDNARLAAEEHAIAFLHLLGDAITAQSTRAVGSAGRETKNARAREYVMRVRELIARRFHEPLTLSTIARSVGCSAFHLSRIVTAHEGVPIYQLIIRHRLRHALEDVLGSTTSLSAIALDAGFASHSHFGDAFRREFGCPPGVARRRGRCA